jgi:hypothetical protein
VATIDRNIPIDVRPVTPVDPPIDPNHCPTCLSGTPPRDPWYEEAIGVEVGHAAG